MYYKRIKPSIIITNVLLFFFLIIFSCSGAVDISIKSASPVILLPLITAFAIFNNLTISAVLGFICGAALDSVSAESYCFNTIFFFVIAIAVHLASNYLFNKNFFGAAALCLLVCAIYFLSLWAVFYAFGVSLLDSIGYLLTHGAPSTIYSAIFIIPFYFLYKKLEKQKEQ